MGRITVRVDSRIRLDARELGDVLAQQLRQDFTHQNPQREMLRRIGKPFWAEPKTIETWSEKPNPGLGSVEELSLPRGGMPRLRARLEEHGLKRLVLDQREPGDPSGQDMPDHLVSLYGYQEQAVRRALEFESGILRAPTGSGKTVVAFGFMARARVCTLVIVYNAGLFDQWVKRGQRELGLPVDGIGVVRGKVRRLRPFTIAMQQTLSAHGVDEPMNRYFGAVVVDETHRAAARTMFAAVDPFRARYRLGISADHRRKDGKEFLTQDLFGGVLDDIKRRDLIRSGHVLEVQIRVVPTDFRADWYGMPTEDRPEAEVDTMRLHQEASQDFCRNELLLSWVLAEQAEGEQVLVFSHLRDHCIALDRRLIGFGVRTGFLIGGEDYRVEFRKTVQGLENGLVRVGVGTFQAVGQAIDLPTVSVGVCATPIASNRQVFNQVRGRFCRISAGKHSARLYYPWDRHVFGLKHLQNICAWNADVVVADDGEWVEGRRYLKRYG
jgi:superfamily II DNA or RNA helicase